MKFLLIILMIFTFTSCKYVVPVDVLYSKTILIDPGHGGKDNGCTFENVYEDDINLNIAKNIYELLLNSDINAYLSRTDDYDLASLYAKNRKNEDLKKRVSLIEKLGCDIFISIHLNSYSNSSVSGPMVYYKQGDDNSFNLAKIIQDNLNKFTNKNKKCHFDNFYLFRKTKVTGVLVECGFLSNFEERKKLLTEKYQKDIATVIFNSLIEYLNNV